jgi:hypothetical protein
MTNFIHRIHDITTGEITETPYTSEEIAIAEAGLAKAKELDAEREKAEADKAALLAKLGITADEAKLLLS